MTDKHDRKHNPGHGQHKHDHKDPEPHHAPASEHHYPGQPISDKPGPAEKAEAGNSQPEEKSGNKGHHKEKHKH